MRRPYKFPTIVRPKDGQWFIKYFFEKPNEPGVFKEFRVRDGVNYIHDLKEKEIAINQLREDVTNALEKLGFNPFNKSESIKMQIQEKLDQFEREDAAPASWTMKEAFDKFITYCKWKNLSSETIRTYRTFINNLQEWLIETNRVNTPISLFTEDDFLLFLNLYDDQEDWEPRTYNNHILFYKTFFNRVKKLEKKINRAIVYEIDLSDTEYKNDASEKNKYYSGTVAKKVKTELEKSQNTLLHHFIKWIFYSCMRPKEIRLMQIQDIDIESRQIKVSGPKGKTGDRLVPISDELIELINELGIKDLPINWYVFGKDGKPGSDLFNKGFFSAKYFKIKDRLGLDKNYTMYGWKHTRVVNLIYAGFKDNQIMTLTGHRDANSFEKYKRGLVLDPDNKMAGKTINF